MLFQIYKFHDLLIKLLEIFDYTYQECFIILQIFYALSKEILVDLYCTFLRLPDAFLDRKLETTCLYFLGKIQSKLNSFN